MSCYNCGYEVSVVSKDDIGWLCEWCSDNELRSPVIKRLKKRLEEFDDDIVIHDKYHDYEVQELLQKILDGKE